MKKQSDSGATGERSGGVNGVMLRLPVKAPWGCGDPYCWDHVATGVILLAPIAYVIFQQAGWLP